MHAHKFKVRYACMVTSVQNNALNKWNLKKTFCKFLLDREEVIKPEAKLCKWKWIFSRLNSCFHTEVKGSWHFHNPTWSTERILDKAFRRNAGIWCNPAAATDGEITSRKDFTSSTTLPYYKRLLRLVSSWPTLLHMLMTSRSNTWC